MNNQKLFGRGVLLAVVAGLFAAGSGSAATTLTNTVGGIWDFNNTVCFGTSKWTDNNDTAQFNTVNTIVNVSTANGPVGAYGLLFPGGGVTFTNQVLLVGAGGTYNVPNVSGTAVSLLFSNNLQLTASQVWSMNHKRHDVVTAGNLLGTADLTFNALGYNGRLILYGSNSLSGTMTVQNAGRLLLDYGAMGQNNSKLDQNSSLILSNSADIQWQSGGASSFTQAVNGLTLAGSGYFYLNRGNSNNVMSVGQIARTGIGSSLILGNTNNAVMTSSINSNGILGAWATTANGWAYNTTDGSPGPLGTFLGTNDNNSSGWTTTENVNMTNATLVTLAGSKQINTLRLGGATNFNLGGNTLTLAAGGLMAASATPTLSNGSIQSGLASGELFVYANTVNLTNSATIQDNGATPTVLVKAGANTMVLGGPNTYSGATYVNQGALLLANGATINTNAINVSYNGTLTFSRTDTLSLSNTFTSYGTVQNTGSGTVNLSTANSTFGLPYSPYATQPVLQNTGAGTLNLNLDGINVFGNIANSGSGTLSLTGAGSVNTAVLFTVSSGGIILSNVSVVTGNGSGSCIGSATPSVGCYLVVAGTNGPNNQTTWNSGGFNIVSKTSGTGSSNNYVMVSEGGVLTNFSLIFGAYAATGPDNALIITNGGQAYGAVQVGNGAGCNSNYIYVGGTDRRGHNALLALGASDVVLSQVGNWMKVDRGGVVTSRNGNIGTGPTNTYNWVQVTGGGLWSLGGTMSVGTGSNNANFNSLLVDNGGMVTNITTLSVGVAGVNGNNYSNVVSVTSGGLLEVKTGISIANNSGATSSGNTVTNFGGILQFTLATPPIAIANYPANALVITNGTVSFRGVNLVNLTNNWVNSGIGTNTVAWQGNNTLRLDGSTATNTLGRPYQFNTDLGPTNYVNLELLGTSFIKGAGVSNGVTIGAAGSMLVSNGTATITGALTNNGTVTLAGSPATLMATNGFYNNGLLTGSGVVSGIVTVGSAGTISAGGTGTVGILTFSTNVVFSSGSTNLWTYNAEAGTWDKINILGNISGSCFIKINGRGQIPANAAAFTFSGTNGTTSFTTSEGYTVTGVTSTNVTVSVSSRGYLMIIQ